MVRYTKGKLTDWYLIQAPKHSHSGLFVTNTVGCVHISTLLSKKNLYLEFDDTNGIGTIQEL